MDFLALNLDKYEGVFSSSYAWQQRVLQNLGAGAEFLQARNSVQEMMKVWHTVEPSDPWYRSTTQLSIGLPAHLVASALVQSPM